MKQIILNLLIIILGFVSCTSPVPIYFNQPIGKSVNGFDSTMLGNFVNVDYFRVDKEVKKKFEIDGLEISFKIPEDTEPLTEGEEISVPLAEGEYEEMAESIEEIFDQEEKNNEVEDSTWLLLGISSKEREEEIQKEYDDIKNENSEENQLLDLNLTYPKIKLGFGEVKDSAIIFSYYNIAPKKITAIGIDSTGKNYANIILEFNESIILTKYLDEYYINSKSDFGWEIMQVEKWHDNYLSFNMFSPTNYNDSCKTEKEFLSSIQYLYPNLKAIENKENKIVGVKAKTKPKKILKLFQMQDETFKYELFKIKKD